MSKKTIVGVIAMCALLLPVAAVAADGAAPAPSTVASQICKQEQVTLGANFKSTYGTNANKSNAFGKCVSKWTQAEHQNRLAATAACTAEQADANFAASHGGKTFAQFYGSGKKGANAMNQCVQSKRAAESAADKQKVVNAARACKAERKAMGAEPFKAKYGNNANAFGKCVSKLAAAKS